MSRLTALALTSALLVVALPAGSAPAGRSPKPVCGPADAKTLVQGRRARVYVVGTRLERADGGAYGYACLARTRGRVLLEGVGCLGSSSGCRTLGPVAVAGRFVAYASQTYGGAYGDEHFALVVLDLRTRKVRYETHEGIPAEVQAGISDVVIRPTGAAAWLWTRGGTPVVSRTPGCGPTTLAEGDDINPAALWRNGRRVFWRQAGQDRSAALCGRGQRP